MFKKHSLLKIIRTCAYLLPFTLFIFWQSTLNPMLTLKVFLLFLISEVLLLAWLALIIYYPEFRPRRSLLLKVLGVFIAVIFISSLFGINLSRSLWSVPERSTGIIFLLHLMLVALALGSLHKEFNWHKYLTLNFWVSVGVGASAFIQYFAPTLFYVTEGTRPGGTLGNPAYLGSYLVLTTFLGLALLIDRMKTGESRKGWRRWLLPLGIASNTLSLFLTETRGAILGFLVGIALLLVWFAFRRATAPAEQRFKKLSRYILIGLCVGAVIIGLTRQAALWQSIPGVNRLVDISTADTAVSNRLTAWKVSWKAFSDRPVAGWGFDNFRYGFDRHYVPTLFRTGFSETYWDRPHNTVLEFMVNTGVVGLASYLALIGLLVYQLLRRNNPFEAIVAFGLVAYFVQNLFIFDTFGSYFIYFVIIGYAISLATHAGEVVATEVRRRWVRPVLLGLGAVAAGYLMYVNTTVVYANYKNYWGVNYFANTLPEKAIVSMNEAVSVRQPYQGSVRQSYILTLQSAIQQMTVPGAAQAIERSMKEMDEALLNDPENYFNHFAYADAKTVFHLISPVYMRGAGALILRAAELSPRRQANYYVSSKINLLQGNVQDAIEEMKIAVDLDPTIGDPHFYYGLLLLSTDRYNEGFAEIDKAKELGREPRTPAEAATLANYYADASMYIDALLLYEYVLEHKPDDIEVLLKYAALLHYLGRDYDAGAPLRRVLELVPNFKEEAIFKTFKPFFDAAQVAY